MNILLQHRHAKMYGLLAGTLLLLLCMLASMLFGLQQFRLETLWQAWTRFDGSVEHLIIMDTRVPRAFIGAIVGGSLAMAGAMMQVLTKNPLASPSILGINAGAVLFLVIGISLLGSQLTLSAMIWVALIGASITAAVVFLLSSQGAEGYTPIKLTLAGAAIAAFGSSVTSGIMLIDKQSLDQAMFWLVGSVAGRELDHLYVVLPYLLLGWLLTFALSGKFNIMALGDDVSRGLGQRVWLVRLLSGLAVVMLAGSSVAIAGPIAFVGLIVPHLCRYLVGNDHRWLLPYCGLTGAILLVAADVGSRFLLMPKEVPVGVMTAFLGVPFLIYIARRRTYV
ncbi:FecCD family ABC transporter permease [Marinicrinis sediminis]|uniref:FecCD family ABC transporter permease n=1 Tax=Marinicrinis sediminis TaxID=1652465 RepID=A0ABW5REI5_9BACL